MCTEPNSDIHLADHHSICMRLQSVVTCTRTNTGAERGADQTSLASYAARHLAPTCRARCPEHIMPAPIVNTPVPPRQKQAPTQPHDPRPCHASPHTSPQDLKLGPTQPRPLDHTTLTFLLLHTHTPAIHCSQMPHDDSTNVLSRDTNAWQTGSGY